MISVKVTYSVPIELTFVLHEVIKACVTNLVVCECHEELLLLIFENKIVIGMIAPFRIVNVINIDIT